MAKKIVFTIAGDAYKVALNIWKKISGSAHVKRIPSNNANLKNAKNLSSTNAAKTQINTARVKLGSERKTTADALRNLGKTSKVKLKSGPLDAAKTSGAAGSRTGGAAGSKTGGAKKTSPWSSSRTSSSTQAQKLRDADVTKGTKINLTNAKSGNIAMRGAKRLGEVTTKGGKKFIKTKTGKLIAIGGGLAGVHYIGKAIDKKIAGTNGAATTTKPPKPPAASSTTGLVTTAPAPPSVLSAQEQAANQTKPPKPSATLMSGRPPDRKSRDVAADMRHFAISKGGTEKDPNRGFRRRLFGENVTEAEAAKDMKESYKAEQADRKKISQQDFYQYGEGRRSQLKGKQGKKKGGSVIKRNKGGPVRGVGKALRGYGNNSIYSNKMY